MVKSSDCLKKYGDPEKQKAMVLWDVPTALEIGVIPKRVYTYDDSTLALIVNGCGLEDEPVVGPFGVVPESLKRR